MNDIRPVKHSQGPAPVDPRPRGETTFNYASYNGRMTLGQEPWSVETKWSHAGINTLHLYDSEMGVRGIAIIEDVKSFDEVDEIRLASADYTSSSRTLRVGQVAAVETQSGYFALLQLSEVRNTEPKPSYTAILKYDILHAGATGHDNSAASLLERVELRRSILQEAREAGSILRGISVSEKPEYGTIGHNGPPTEHILTEADRQNTLAAVDDIRDQALSNQPNRSILLSAIAIVENMSSQTKIWLGAIGAGVISSTADTFTQTVIQSLSDHLKSLADLAMQLL